MGLVRLRYACLKLLLAAVFGYLHGVGWVSGSALGLGGGVHLGWRLRERQARVEVGQWAWVVPHWCLGLAGPLWVGKVI